MLVSSPHRTVLAKKKCSIPFYLLHAILFVLLYDCCMYVCIKLQPSDKNISINTRLNFKTLTSNPPMKLKLKHFCWFSRYCVVQKETKRCCACNCVPRLANPLFLQSRSSLVKTHAHIDLRQGTYYLSLLFSSIGAGFA